MIELPEDFEELIDALRNCDGMGSAITISDTELRSLLISKGLAVENSKHSLGGSKLLSYMWRACEGNIEFIKKHLTE